MTNSRKDEPPSYPRSKLILVLDPLYGAPIVSRNVRRRAVRANRTQGSRKSRG